MSITTDTVSDSPPAANPPRTVSFSEALKVWSRIGWLSFGGPAGQIALMHRELVEQRRWISESRFLHALNYCMLLPGPEAQQLATYIGWLMHRTWGGIVAGGLFVLPGVIAMLLLSWLYVRYADVAAMTVVFFGLKAAVLAIVVSAVLRIGSRALKNSFMVGIAAAAFITIWAFHVPFPLVVLGAALIGFFAKKYVAGNSHGSASDISDDGEYIVDRMQADGHLSHAQPSTRRAVVVTITCLALWLAPVAAVAVWLGSQHVLVKEGVMFSQTAVVTFGGAYAVLAYVAQRAVEHLQWLQPGEMIDGLALAETTPGPLIMVLQFVGFLAAYRFAEPLNPWVAATLGALLTTWVTFLPSFLFIFLGAPYMESLRRHRGLNAALSCVTAAVVGVILNLSIWFAIHTLFGKVNRIDAGPMRLDVPEWTTIEPGAVLLSLAAFIALARYKLSMVWVLVGCVLAGAAYWWIRYG
ncbi:chromate efflux transporter [Steroidobacter agaridevorans]|uniref:chromate efflux transporter n=1 Tax=Steroidobacter agaridevorans TaxID=2695856 RepID=UPI001329DBF7|nr:chromate efflux transporter [Steroidobacter agaridevorans]GFE87518.1 chromate transporter [Steroidobacter agaridevorans]